MPPEGLSGLRSIFAQNKGLLFPVLIVAAVLVIIAPLPPLVMDLLLACNVTLAVVILLTSIHVRKPLEFSVFPSILLGTTLARLVLNIASTRLILTHGADGTGAAGGVIEAFGHFVAGGQIVVGIILFAILIAVQFLVITRGSTRISEVAARFALDGMPGKQMAIDADVNAGVLTPEEARKRREEVSQEADFYGAMDGASKFVRGDSIAGLLITLINIAGGLYVGMFDRGMDIGRAIEVFTTLTIGDGLVSQLPALLIAIAAGLLVTRSSTESQLSEDVVGQVFRHPAALYLSAVFVLCLSFTGLPTLPMVGLAVGCALTGFILQTSAPVLADNQDSEAAESDVSESPMERPESQLLVHPLELDLGVGLLRLADVESGGELLDRVSRVRFKMANELGILMPKVRIRDNIRISKRSYEIKVRGIAVAWGECYPNALLAIETGRVTESHTLRGIETTEPALQRPARWIERDQHERAEQLGFTVVEPTTLLTTHLAEVVRDHCHEILTRQQVHQLLENLRATSPRVVDELVPGLMKPAQIQQVLSNLLREQVPIRDLETILETLGHYAESTSDPDVLTEAARQSLSRSLCERQRNEERVLQAVVIDPELEELLENPTAAGHEIEGTRDLLTAVRESWSRWSRQHPGLVLLCRDSLRRSVRTLIESEFPRLPVFSLREISRDTEVQVVQRIQPQFALAADSV